MDAGRQWLGTLIAGYRGTAILGAAACLSLADHLVDGPSTIDHLAALTATRTDRLDQLMRALVSLGVVRAVDPDSYALTPVGELLRSDFPGSMRGSAIYAFSVSLQAFAHLQSSLSTETCAFVEQFGGDFYDIVLPDPKLSAAFFDMVGADALASALVTAHDFSDAETIVDLGGGDGTVLAAVLFANPNAQGVLVDRPAANVIADEVGPHGDLNPRFQVRHEDIRESIAPAGDVYILSRVLANWDDESSRQILRNIGEAMSATSQVLIIELPVARDIEFGAVGTVASIDLMINFGGRLRTIDELEGLMKGAGMVLIDVRPIPVENDAEWCLLVGAMGPNGKRA